MTDETQTTETTPEAPLLSDLAAETFGSDYVGAPGEEPEERPHYESDEEAFDAMKAADAESAELAEKAQELVQKAEDQTQQQNSADDDEPDDGLRYTDRDLAVLTHIQQEAMRFNTDAKQYMAQIAEIQRQYGVNSIEELQKVDRARAVQLVTDRQDLARRQGELKEAVEFVNQAATEQQKHIGRSKEYKKMVKAEPELAKPEVRQQLRAFLIDLGVDAAEVDSATEAKPLIAAYRAMKKTAAPTRTAKVRRSNPTKKQGRAAFVSGRVGRATTSDKARERLMETGRIEDALSVLSLERQGA